MMPLIKKLFESDGQKIINQIDTNESINILVIRRHNQIGDLICSLSLFYALKKKFPKSKITLLASPTNYPIPYFDINPYLDEVIIDEKGTLFKRIDIIKKLRKHKFEIGIVPSTIAISRSSHITNFLSGAKVRIGVKSIDEQYNSMEYLLNIKKDFWWKTNKVNQRERNLDVVKQIGCNLTEEEKQNIRIEPSKEDIKFIDEFIETNFGITEKKLVGFHPGAGKTNHIWHLNNFVNLTERLNNKYNCNFVITSGATDKEITFNIKNILSSKKINFAIAQDFTIKQLLALFNRLNLYITNDTGVMHIAGLTRVPIISLFLPDKAYEWSPVGLNKFFIESPSQNINEIKVDDVFNLAEKIL